MTDYLNNTVASLSETVELLQNSIDQLHKNSSPNNNLTNSILQTKRYFELISEYDVEKAKLAQDEEIDPLVNTLHDKLGKSLSKLQREYDTLQKTYELNKLRLNNRDNEDNNDNVENPETTNDIDFDLSTDVVIMASSTNEELETLKELKLKRAELEKQLREIQDTQDTD